MTVEKVIEELKKFPPNYEVYAINLKGIFCRVDNIVKDETFDDLLITAEEKEPAE